MKKKGLLIGFVIILLVAGVMANIFFWNRITRETQRQQNNWRSSLDTLSTQVAAQQITLTALQVKFSQRLHATQQSNDQQTLNEMSYLLDIAHLYLQINHDPANALKLLALAQYHAEEI